MPDTVETVLDFIHGLDASGIPDDARHHARRRMAAISIGECESTQKTRSPAIAIAAVL